MNLGDLITRLEAADPNQIVRHGFHNPHSYRGDYYDLAFEPAQNITVADMLTAARSALDTTYQGYKGGDFTMREHTWCWLSEQGDASGETISTLLLDLMLTQPVDQATTPKHAYRVSEIRDNVVRRIHGYYASLDGALAYCEAEERKKPLINTARFELFPMPGGDQWLIHSYYGPKDNWPETSELVIRRVDVLEA